MDSTTRKRFELGSVVGTRGATESIPHDEIIGALQKHVRGDWSEVPEEDAQENELSLVEGFRILSAYSSLDGIKFWIITEADRSSTTILLPEEY